MSSVYSIQKFKTQTKSLEKLTLDEHTDQIIEIGAQSFYAIGLHIYTVNKTEKYKQKFETFEDWVRENFSFTRERAYEYIKAIKVVEIISTIKPKFWPLNDSQARVMHGLDPDTVRDVWSHVCDLLDENDNLKLTAAMISRVVKEHTKASKTQEFDQAMIDAKKEELITEIQESAQIIDKNGEVIIPKPEKPQSVHRSTGVQVSKKVTAAYRTIVELLQESKMGPDEIRDLGMLLMQNALDIDIAEESLMLEDEPF